MKNSDKTNQISSLFLWQVDGEKKIPTGSGSRLRQVQNRFIRLKTGC